MKKLIYLFTLVMLVSGCIRVEYRKNFPEGINKANTIYIIESPKVRDDFLDTMKNWLDQHKYEIKILPPGSKIEDYEWVLTYTARWEWDFTVYMDEAKISAYKNGVYSGEASYHSAGGSFAKWGGARDKIKRMMDNLFGSRESLPTEKITELEEKTPSKSLEQPNPEFPPDKGVNNGIEQESSKINMPVKEVSPIDDIRKYKELLDSGAITQEEYEQKKKQLLGL